MLDSSCLKDAGLRGWEDTRWYKTGPAPWFYSGRRSVGGWAGGKWRPALAQLWAQLEKDELQVGVAEAECPKSGTHSTLPRRSGSKGRRAEAFWEKRQRGNSMGGCEAVHKVLGRNQVDGLDPRGGASSDPAIEHFKRQASDL